MINDFPNGRNDPGLHSLAELLEREPVTVKVEDYVKCR